MRTIGRRIARRGSRAFTVAASVLAAVLVGNAGASGRADLPTTMPTTWPADAPPAAWLDADTGHVVRRVTSEPNSGGLYFNFDAYTPDGKQMVYSAPDGLRLLDLDTFASKLVAPGKVRAVGVGRKTRTLYFVDTAAKAVNSVDLDSGRITKRADLPKRGSVVTVNADETLVAGTYIEGDAGQDYGEKRVMPPGLSGPNVQPMNKAQMMEERLAARLPMALFTIDLRTGEKRDLLKSTDWLNHLLFSPSDPTLLMYCREGPWQKVDRIWTIRTDGSQNQLIHRRTMAMEIAGHEFWGADGRTVWYDLQRPKGEDFFLAAYDVETGRRTWYHLERNEWSIHFNVTDDGTLFCGDGGDTGQVARAPDGKWIQLFRPELTKVTGENAPDFVQPGVLRSERLVNMKGHNYKLEPNVRFSPDGKRVFFTSNLLGPSYLFAVDVEKAATR